MIVMVLGRSTYYNINIKKRINESVYASVYIVNEHLYGKDTSKFFVLSNEDMKEISTVLNKTIYIRKIIQDDSFYNHYSDVVSIKIQYYNQEEKELLGMTFYSDGIYIIDGKYVDINFNIYDYLCKFVCCD